MKKCCQKNDDKDYETIQEYIAAEANPQKKSNHNEYASKADFI